MTTKGQCEILVVLLAAAWALALACNFYPAYAAPLTAAVVVVGLPFMVALRAPLLASAGIHLVKDGKRLTRLRRILTIWTAPPVVFVTLYLFNVL